MSEPVDDAVNAILGLLGPAPDANGVRTATAAGVAGWQVFDGPPLADIENPDVIGVGLAVEGGAAAVGETRREIGGRHVESFTVSCAVQSWSGDTAMSGMRVRAYGGFRAVRDVLVANRDLGGVCDWARVVRHTYRPVQGPDGALALIDFAIRVDATRFEGV